MQAKVTSGSSTKWTCSVPLMSCAPGDSESQPRTPVRILNVCHPTLYRNAQATRGACEHTGLLLSQGTYHKIHVYEVTPIHSYIHTYIHRSLVCSPNLPNILRQSWPKKGVIKPKMFVLFCFVLV